MSFRTVEGAEKRLSPSLESEAAPQGLAEFHVPVKLNFEFYLQIVFCNKSVSEMSE